MIALIRCEVRKLHGSLALLLAIVAPAMPGVLAALALASSRRETSWTSAYTQFVMPLWVMFLLPMTVAAFATLVAQIEYKGRGWDHLLALPVARWQVFAAKALVVLVAAVAMTGLMLAFAAAGIALGGSIGRFPPAGDVPFALLARIVPLLLAASALLVVLQLWVALRVSSFVVPLTVGIGGTLVALAVAITGTTQADWFPWALPLKAFRADDPLPFALIGGVGGAVALVLMIADLSRRSFR